MTKYDPVVRQLLKQASAQGFTCYQAFDSCEYLDVTIDTPESEIISWVTSSDTGHLHFENAKGHLLTFLFVYGNDLWETIADHTDDSDAEQIANRVASHFGDVS
jgi:hypothetical protein